MKRRISLPLLTALFLVTLTLASCATKGSALSDLRELSSDIEQKGSTYSLNDWKKVKNRYQSIDHRISRQEWTDEEREEIGTLKGRCLKYFAKGVVKNMVGKVSGAASEIRGVLEGLGLPDNK